MTKGSQSSAPAHAKRAASDARSISAPKPSLGLSRFHRYVTKPWQQWLAWVLLSIVVLFVSAVVSAIAVRFVSSLGIVWNLTTPQGMAAMQVVLYGVMIGCFVLAAWAWRSPLTLRQAGMWRMPQWREVGLAVLGIIAYLLASMLVLTVARLVPGFQADQAQQLGLAGGYQSQTALLFVMFVVIVPIVEEVLFRGILYGRLRRARMPMWGCVLLVSVLFAAAHGQWNVALDTFCLSVVACLLREITGTIWAGVVLHMIKNAIAFVVMFVLPMMIVR